MSKNDTVSPGIPVVPENPGNPGRITFRCEGSGRLILVEMSEEEGLSYVLERFAEFLRAVGFKVDGELDVVKEE